MLNPGLIGSNLIMRRWRKLVRKQLSRLEGTLVVIGSSPLQPCLFILLLINHLIPTHLQDRYHKMFKQPKRDAKLSISIVTGVFCTNAHKMIEAKEMEVSQFDIDQADMDWEVREYLVLMSAFNPNSFHLQVTHSGYSAEVKVYSTQVKDTFLSLSMIFFRHIHIWLMFHIILYFSWSEGYFWKHLFLFRGF